MMIKQNMTPFFTLKTETIINENDTDDIFKSTNTTFK